MKRPLSVILSMTLMVISTVPATAANVECVRGRYVLGTPLASYRTQLLGFCVNWDTGRFVGYETDGDSVSTFLDRMEPLYTYSGRRVNLIAPPPPLPQDSLYLALKNKPLEAMTEREYEYFMLKQRAELENARTLTGQRAEMERTEAVKRLGGDYLALLGAGLLLSLVIWLSVL